MWTKVRRSVLTGELSKRQACKKYGIHWDTLQKILANPEPPKRRKSKATVWLTEPLMEPQTRVSRVKPTLKLLKTNGTGGWIRTIDLLIHNQAL